MKLLGYCYSDEETWRVTSLLKAKGIPTFTKAAFLRRAPYKMAVFVCIEQHLQDAKALLHNSNHTVSEPIDVEEYERMAGNIGEGPILKWLFIILAVVVILFVSTVYMFGHIDSPNT